MLKQLDEFIGFAFLGILSLGLTVVSLIVAMVVVVGVFSVWLPLDAFEAAFSSAAGVMVLTLLTVVGVGGWLTFVLWAIGELKNRN